ncbi:660_t:CDS:2 [Entrophospora sp. SA101]|nr:660_t:CDS:2 [Entrophospora sp. SA101]
MFKNISSAVQERKFSTPVTHNDDDLNAKADVKMSGYEFAANKMLSVNFFSFSN